MHIYRASGSHVITAAAKACHHLYIRMVFLAEDKYLLSYTAHFCCMLLQLAPVKFQASRVSIYQRS